MALVIVALVIGSILVNSSSVCGASASLELSVVILPQVVFAPWKVLQTLDIWTPRQHVQQPRRYGVLFWQLTLSVFIGPTVTVAWSALRLADAQSRLYGVDPLFTALSVAFMHCYTIGQVPMIVVRLRALFAVLGRFSPDQQQQQQSPNSYANQHSPRDDANNASPGSSSQPNQQSPLPVVVAAASSPSQRSPMQSDHHGHSADAAALAARSKRTLHLFELGINGQMALWAVSSYVWIGALDRKSTRLNSSHT